MSQQPHVAIGPKGASDYQKLKVDSVGNLLVSPVGAGGAADTRIVGANSPGTPVTTTSQGAKTLLDVAVQDIHLSATSDSIQIGDGTRTVGVTANNELKVSLSSSLDIPAATLYQEVLSVVNGVTTTVLSHTFSSVNNKIFALSASGTNGATYELLINAVLIEKKRTYFGNALDTNFKFYPYLKIINGSVLQLKVTHSRLTLGDFNATLKYYEGT